MEPLCEFCWAVRAVVYCKADSARLCLHCDGCVHTANSLSRRHSRSLLCDKCNSQPAMIRCMDHKLSSCQGCDWNPNDCSALGHRRLTLNSYTGSPSLAEFSRIWSFVFDVNSSHGGWEFVGTLPKSESCTSQCLEQPDHNGGSFGLMSEKLDEIESCFRYEPWMGQCHIIPSNPNYTPFCKEEAFFLPRDSNQPKVSLLLILCFGSFVSNIYALFLTCKYNTPGFSILSVRFFAPSIYKYMSNKAIHCTRIKKTL